jgi:hypothetical protein
MKPLALISCDTNPDYLFLTPIVAKSWELQGFEVEVCIVSDQTPIEAGDLIRKYADVSVTHVYSKAEGMNKTLKVQCYRMYRAMKHLDRYVILTDADMFIGSSFLYRDFDKVNVFGHDLTDRNHVPICYVGATGNKWGHIMGTGGMNEDIDAYCDLTTKEKAWGCDQDILTAKLKEYGFKNINFIDRGTDPNNLNLPLGRWDRYAGFRQPKVQVHDVHLPRDPFSDDNFKKILDMCETLYPDEPWSWVLRYRREFIKSLV